jgi:hypothetical protein
MGHELALQHTQEPVGMVRLLEDFTSLQGGKCVRSLAVNINDFSCLLAGSCGVSNRRPISSAEVPGMARDGRGCLRHPHAA